VCPDAPVVTTGRVANQTSGNQAARSEVQSCCEVTSTLRQTLTELTMRTCTPENRGIPNNFKTVLVLSDDALVRTAVVQLLRESGYRVVEAESTDRGIEIMRHRDILLDVVISDVEITGSINGFQFAKWARLIRPQLKIMLAGTPERMARNAAELSEIGPRRKRTYEHALGMERMKRLLAARSSKHKPW
jgi:CheY-like chemotaxis protein